MRCSMRDELNRMDFVLWTQQIWSGGKTMWQHKHNWGGVHTQTRWLNKIVTHNTYNINKLIIYKHYLASVDNTEKIWLQLVAWGSCKPSQWVQGDALVKAWVQSFQTIFFFRIKHAKTVTARVNIGYKISAIILL